MGSMPNIPAHKMYTVRVRAQFIQGRKKYLQDSRKRRVASNNVMRIYCSLTQESCKLVFTLSKCYKSEHNRQHRHLENIHWYINKPT